jgi:precorrin-4 methylase
MVVKLHSGDPSLFEGASVYLRALAERGIQAEIVFGVSSLSAVAASLGTELVKDQALIVIRPAGEPWRDDYRFESGSIEELSGYGAATAAAMAIFIGS